MDLLQRLIAASFLLPGLSMAAVTSSGPSVVYSGNSGSVLYGNDFHDLMGRSIKNDNIGGGAKVSDAVRVQTSRGAVTATATRAVSASAIARGASVAARALPFVGTAIAVGQAGYWIYNLLDDNRIQPDGHGNNMWDPGVPQGMYPGVCWYTRNTCHKSIQAAASYWVTGYNMGQTDPLFKAAALVSVTQTSPTSGTMRVTFGGQGGSNFSIVGYAEQQLQCPPPPASTGELGPDGKCATGRYTQPLTDEEVAGKVEDSVKKMPDRVPLVTDILSRPAAGIESGPTTTSGPSSATGTPPAPLVVNTPSGPETRTESPDIAIRYRGPQVEWEPKEVTTTRPGPNPGDPDETTVEHAPDEPSADPSAAAAPDPCIANPKRAGCSELGDVEGPQWDPSEKPIELKAQSPWGSDNAGCPPPRIFTIGGRQIPMEWTLWCQFFAGIRFAVIAGAWVAAVLIFLGGKTE